MPEIVIERATRRDTSQIAMNMREIDRHEIFALLDDERATYLAYVQLATSKRWAYNAFIIHDDGFREPVCAFGINEYRAGIGEVWAFGTDRMYGALRAVTDHIRWIIAEEVWNDKSIWRLECRSSFDHIQAHSWIESIGLYWVERPLLNFGKNGEHYWLFETSRYQIGELDFKQYLEKKICVEDKARQRRSQLTSLYCRTTPTSDLKPTQQESVKPLPTVGGLRLRRAV